MAQQFGPAPRSLKLTSGKVVTERFYDAAQYHQNCRKCGGDTYGMAIWYVRKNEANLAPKHVECPAEPVPYVEPQRAYVAPAPKSQSVYAQRRDAARADGAQERYDSIQAQRERDIRDGVRHGGVAVGDLGYWLGDQFIEVE